jgi:hypothetical protein
LNRSLDVGPMFAAAVWINRCTRYWQTQFETLAAWLGCRRGGLRPQTHLDLIVGRRAAISRRAIAALTGDDDVYLSIKGLSAGRGRGAGEWSG